MASPNPHPLPTHLGHIVLPPPFPTLAPSDGDDDEEEPRGRDDRKPTCLPVGHATVGRMLTAVTEAEALQAHNRRRLQLQAIVNEVFGEVTSAMAGGGVDMPVLKSWPSSKW